MQPIRSIPLPVRALFNRPISRATFNLAFSAFLVLFYNDSLWQLMLSIVEPDSLYNIAILAAFMLFIVMVLNLLMSLFILARAHKAFAIFLVLSAASISYFMDAYNIMIDKSMVQNAFETDAREVSELVTAGLVLTLVIKGLLPAAIIFAIRIKRRPLIQELKAGILAAIASLILAMLVIGSFYKDFSLIFRENRQIRYLITPTNYLYYSLRHLSGAYTPQDKPLTTIAEDAAVNPRWTAIDGQKPLLTMVIVGETARAQNFSLNGYVRKTNPVLANLDVINFSNVTACGTSTAISVPCMFSDKPRDGFDVDNARFRENLMDIFKRVGFNLHWRENNSGCKGVCERIPTFKQIDFSASRWCEGVDCFDEAMLYQLDKALKPNKQNTVLTLHQLGSHGPAYNKRYPKGFEQFSPVCEQRDVSTCSREEISNGYDNSILYTDYLIGEAINFLKRHADRYDTNLIYVSDHGESLGENGLYLHGLPWFLAPAEQTQVPMVAWFSENYANRFALDRECINKRAVQPASHDNLFHSLLGLMGVETTAYNKNLDLFKPCLGAAT